MIQGVTQDDNLVQFTSVREALFHLCYSRCALPIELRRGQLFSVETKLGGWWYICLLNSYFYVLLPVVINPHQ